MTLNQAIDNLMGREYGVDVIRDVADEAYRHVFSLLDNEFLSHEMGADEAGRIAALVERTLADALRSHFGNTGHAA